MESCWSLPWRQALLRHNDDDYGNLARDEVGCQRRKAIVLVLRATIFDRHVLSLNIADFRETPPDGVHAVSVSFGRSRRKEPDHGHHWLLRARNERPCCRRATESPEKFPPPHARPAQETASCRLNECFNRPETSRCRVHSCRCPLWVISGHLQCKMRMSALPPIADIKRTGCDVRFVPLATNAPQQMMRYSITSSAIASTPDGIARPSVLAVLRLITNSNLVGCMTGRSAGFSPLRMRAA